MRAKNNERNSWKSKKKSRLFSKTSRSKLPLLSQILLKKFQTRTKKLYISENKIIYFELTEHEF